MPLVTLTELLARYGLSEPSLALIEPGQDAEGSWGVKFAARGGNTFYFDITRASKLAAQLRWIGEARLGDAIDKVAEVAEAMSKGPEEKTSWV